MTVVTMLSAVSQPGGDERAEELSQPRQTPLLLLIPRLCFALLIAQHRQVSAALLGPGFG